MINRILLLIAIISPAVLLISCSGGGAATTNSTLPTTAVATAAPTQAVAATRAPTQAVVMTSAAKLASAATATTAPTLPKPTVPPTSPTTATTSSSSSQGSTTKLDLNKIFPPGPGRDLVLNNCTNCHSIVPIVVLQKNQQQWDEWALNHRERVPSLSDQDFATLKAYLVANFNPQHPVPDLPPDLLNSWTSY